MLIDKDMSILFSSVMDHLTAENATRGLTMQVLFCLT